MNLKNKILLPSVLTYQKRKEVPYMEISRDSDQKRKESHKKSRDNNQKKMHI